jgi:hypothetical protein
MSYIKAVEDYYDNLEFILKLQNSETVHQSTGLTFSLTVAICVRIKIMNESIKRDVATISFH